MHKINNLQGDFAGWVYNCEASTSFIRDEPIEAARLYAW